MNIKMIVVLIAALAAAPTSFAAERFGRDSVHANPVTPSTTASDSTNATRYGRDSVYTTQAPIRHNQRTANTGPVQFKAGRA